MSKFFGYLLTPFFYLAFFGLLGFFHPFQVLAHWILGEQARRRVVEILNFFITKSLLILGSNAKFNGKEKIPQNCPIIIVSNHQSGFDIPPFVWGFRKQHPKFIAKKELGKWLPSISYNLRHGGSVLIDRNNGQQSIRQVIKLGQFIEKDKSAVVIFPEGTRSKTGKVKQFQTAGLASLLRAAPSAIVVPFAIKGHCEIQQSGIYPLLCGEKVSYTVLDAIDPKGKTVEEIAEQCQQAIQRSLDEN